MPTAAAWLLLSALTVSQAPEVPEVQWSGMPTRQVIDVALAEYARGNYAEAARLLESLVPFAPHASAAAAYALADLYERGLGVRQDLARAWTCYVLATAGSDRDIEQLAYGALARLTPSMSGADRQAAEAMLSRGFRTGLSDGIQPIDDGTSLEISEGEAFLLQRGRRQEYHLDTLFADAFVALSVVTVTGRSGRPVRLLQDIRWRVVNDTPALTRALMLTISELSGGAGCQVTLLRVRGSEVLPDAIVGRVIRETLVRREPGGNLTCHPPRDLRWLTGR